MHVTQAARQFQAAQEQYHWAFRDYLAHEVAVLSDDRFWQIQAVFVREVICFRFGYNRTNGVEQAAREMFRKPLAGDFSSRDDQPPLQYTLAEATQFAKSWQQLSRRLYRPLFDLVTDRGDDSYGDLLDALPLAGRTVIETSLAGGYRDHACFEQAVRTACHPCPQLAALILHGEQYIGMLLGDAARDYFAMADADCPVS